MDRRDRQAIGYGKRLRRAAQALGRRANAGLAQSKPASRQGLRTDHRVRNRMALHRFDPALHPPNRKAMKLRPIILNQAHRFRAALSEMMPSLRSANTPFHSGLRGTQRLSIGVQKGPPIGRSEKNTYELQSLMRISY